MVVQHNLIAMNSQRMLGLTTSAQAKSTEKLSSGYKINRAADDAAGLSISEKMRKQIRGLTQASANAEDGISAVQTAEGALTEVHDMLQRMNELAVKAANGTQSEDDRKYIQDEIDQLVAEIDRVSITTKFNESYLLNGDANTVTSYSTATTAVAANTMLTSIGTVNVDAAKGTATISVTAGTSNVASTDGKKTVKYETEATVTSAVSTAKQAGQTVISSGNTTTIKDASGNTTVYCTTKDSFLSATKYMVMAEDDNIKSMAFDENGNLKIDTFANSKEALSLTFQVGADTTQDNKIGISVTQLSARGLGINGLRVDGTNSDNADEAVNTIAAALQQVSTQRSALGAIQNRLEHTINNLDNVVENTTAAESQIRDTDMADEMVKYSNNNILSQAGQAMLAQANQSNQGVLSLLG